MATSLTTGDYRVHTGYEIIRDIGTTAEDTYYAFIGNHMSITGNTIPSVADDTNDLMVSVYRNMICGKIIQPSDASMMIRNIPWVANTVYTMYDDQDTQQNNHNFFAIVNAGAYSHIWKCLDNNLGAKSIVTPDISQISANDISYRTGDGYLWKYMASVDSLTVNKFATTSYFPITVNTQVTSAAISGAIDAFVISNTGSGYTNYLLGTFAASDVRPNGNTVIYAVTGNNLSSTVNGYYTGCSLYISAGAGIGHYKTITDYFSNANGNFIVVDSAFAVPPQNGSQYQIYPGVVITGSGDQTVSAAARALVNSVGNTIYRIDMLNRGAGYDYIAANVVANAVVSSLNYPAQIRGVYGPYKGHGYNAYEELDATQIAFSVQFANTEGNTIPATNQYQQIGILKNPQFQNCVVNCSVVHGTFIASENVITYTTRLLQNSNITVASGSPNVSISNGYVTSQVGVGDPVILHAQNSFFWYSTVNSIANDTFLTLSTPVPWACSSASMELAVLQTGQGVVSGLPGGNRVTLSNVSGTFATGTQLIGLSSGTQAVVNNVIRNGQIKPFTTFVGLSTLVATTVTGTFQPNEIVYQGANLASATSTAAVHSVTANSGTLTILVSNTVGGFMNTSLTITGANSGAVATLTAQYGPEIQFGSSKLLYVENIAPVTRSNTTTDLIEVIFQF